MMALMALLPELAQTQSATKNVHNTQPATAQILIATKILQKEATPASVMDTLLTPNVMIVPQTQPAGMEKSRVNKTIIWTANPAWPVHITA